MTYAEKLLDPRWQKKRLEVLNRDGFTCRCCKKKNKTLHVHHLSYSANPWEVDLYNLITYCAHCHLVVEFLKNVYKITTIKSYWVREPLYEKTPLYFIKIGDVDTDAYDRVLIIQINNEKPSIVTTMYAIDACVLNSVFESNTNDDMYV